MQLGMLMTKTNPRRKEHEKGGRRKSCAASTIVMCTHVIGANMTGEIVPFSSLPRYVHVRSVQKMPSLNTSMYEYAFYVR